MLKLKTTTRSHLDILDLPAEFHSPLNDYTRGVLSNEELEMLGGRWLLHVQFVDEADDDTPEAIVQQLADGSIGFEQYPYQGIDWDLLGCKPSAYAGYLRAMRYLRQHLPASVVANNSLLLLV